MPGLKVAVSSGNWSSTSTWSGGVLPSAGDVVASNGFTVTIDQNVNVDSITNAAQSTVTATAAMTGYSTPIGYLVEASNYQEPAWQAFDRNGSSRGWVQNLPLWISYTFPSTTIINSYRLDMYVDNHYAMQDFTFQGWNGSSWVVLHTVTGNTLITYTSSSIGNTTAYIKYRFHCTSTSGTAGVIYQEIALYELGYESAAVQGGTFNLNSGVTVTLTGTNSINQGAVTVLTCNVTTGNTSTLIGNNFNRANVSNQPLIVLAGAGTFNISGTMVYGGLSPGVTVTGVNSILNYTGTINAGSSGASHGINTDIVCTINLVGTTTGGFSSNGIIGVRFNSAGLFTLVGTATGGGYNSNFGVYLNNTTATITGDLYGGNGYGGDSPGLRGDNNANITVTGTMYGRVSPGFTSISNTYLNHYGSIISTGIHGGGGSQSNVGLSSTGAGAINILTGPFISSPTGIQPLYVTRMHYRRTIGSYFEFRDNSTNGALPPAAAAPATRLVSPDTIIAAPIPANVRQGTVYALGSQTGTMIVPNPANVIKNVPVDNTVGTGVLDPSALWAVPLSAINTTNSIGQRVKNASTVESTGAQIQTTLNNNP